MKRLFSLFLILAMAVAMFSVAGAALAQTPDPTEEPTAEPTAEPTEEPTAEPTVEPTTEPTAEPTVEPTTEPTAEPTVEPTTEPTAEPTVEPTTEPTAEPTTEPTAEPTVEPTAEPTVEPTAEPTVEPTAEPTVEPTTEPTVEPTTEPTVEPTTEPTVEPVEAPVINYFFANPPALTSDGTTVLTATLSWDVTGADSLALDGQDVISGTTEQIVEVTETTTYTLAATNAGGSAEAQVVVTVEEVVAEVEDAGNIEASAITGSWTSSYISVQNLSSSSLANATLSLYDASGVLTGTVTKSNIPIGGNEIFSSSDTDFPSGDWALSGILSSDQPVAAAVMNVNTTGQLGDVYVGFETGTSNPTANTVILPNVLNGHSNWHSKFTIQDASGGGQTVRVYAYLAGSGTASDSPVFAIPANGFVTVDLADTSKFPNYGSGTGKHGYARIEGSAALAVVNSNIKDEGSTSKNIEALYGGLSTAEAGRDFVIPLALNGHSNWNTGMNIINLSSSVTTTIEITYSINSAYGGGVETFSVDLAESEKLSWLLAQEASLRPSYGGLSVHSTNSDVVIIAGTSKFESSGGNVGYAVPALNTSLATNKIAVPLALRQGLGSGGGYNGGVNVYSVGSSSTITTTWVRQGANTTSGVANTDYFVHTKAGTTNGATNFLGASLGIPDDFVGVVYVESAAPILAFTGATNYNDYISYQIRAFNYN